MEIKSKMTNIYITGDLKEKNTFGGGRRNEAF
jgi:hypothetical protein